MSVISVAPICGLTQHRQVNTGYALVNTLLAIIFTHVNLRGMDIQIALAACGGRKAELARRLGVSKPAVSRWVKTGRLPKMRVWQWKALEAVTPPIAADSTATPG
jgi:transcriptional regulator with XRE-family HTH domain